MMPGPAASHGNALNADWTNRKLDRTAFRRTFQVVPVAFGRIRTSLFDARQRSIFWGSDSLPDPRQQAVAGAGQTVRRVYRRAAQAYMLISMPTGTSTIFGVFQLIRVSPKQCWHDIRAGIKTRLTSNTAQGRNIRR
jgi:hypothetical protein